MTRSLNEMVNGFRKLIDRTYVNRKYDSGLHILYGAGNDTPVHLAYIFTEGMCDVGQGLSVLVRSQLGFISNVGTWCQSIHSHYSSPYGKCQQAHPTPSSYSTTYSTTGRITKPVGILH
jgi:hypothetical protein